MKILYWFIVLCGLWEFADVAAVFVPDFGEIRPFVWSHIFTGFILMVAGAASALAGKAGITRTMTWITACAGVWLILAPFILGMPEHPAGLWNDVLVGALVFGLSVLARWFECTGRNQTNGPTINESAKPNSGERRAGKRGKTKAR